MRPNTRIVLFLAGLLTAVFIAAAAGPGSTHTANAATGGVSIKSFRYSPATITVKPGEAVRWVNDEDSVPHTVTSEKAGGFSSASLKPGESYLQTFDQAGAYNYFCAIHPGMRGVVLVGDATGAPSTPPPPPPPTPKAPATGTGSLSGGSADGTWSQAGLLLAVLGVSVAVTVFSLKRRQA